jgi:RHH-type proline utilization regulon transcriptional repressor/proline dehydrogenase/delta 1-pyrroline-5-carboxylate dehydrogenase
LENGANSSFVHRLVDASCPPEQLTKHPVEQLLALPGLDNQAISLPPAIYPDRKNSLGINMDIDSQRIPFNAQVNAFLDYRWTAGPVIGGKALYEPLRDSGEALMPVTAPYDRSITVGQVIFARSEHIDQAFASATEACDAWRDLPVTARALCLNRLADLLEGNRAELVALCHMEAGKTIHDAIDEIREAVDFCRYYATQSQVCQVQQATGFDGKPLAISRQGRGVFVCISPWNFPLAIFLGQITAALMAGNAVIAKPAEQTSLIAARAARLIQQAGFPDGVFHLLPGNGTELGSALIAHPKVAGVAFTGSTQTAMRINQSLAGRAGEPIPMIAETGGQNAMIVDSTALPQQVVRDVLRSAFGSAGQRCSALRVLCIQEDVAEHIIKLISGAMDELSVGIPYLYQTDVGPVIDSAAKEKLNAHIEQMKQTQQLVKQLELVSDCDKGDFVAPAAFEISDLSVLTEEKFGPILHIVRFKASELPQLIEKINATGYGLTLGIHSRNATTYQWIEKHAKVGNSYVNRDQIGAVVGVQPFGGQGLSGTGPKAGGPHYLYRFTETKFDQPVNAAQA